MRFKVILMTLILAVMLLPGFARAQEWVDELNLPTEGVYWEYLGLAAASADTLHLGGLASGRADSVKVFVGY